MAVLRRTIDDYGLTIDAGDGMLASMRSGAFSEGKSHTLAG